MKKNIIKTDDTRDLIIAECDSIKELLLQKNDAYGSSFRQPINIFSKAEAIEQVKVRIDDKLNRIAKGKNLDKVQEDTVLDLIGYLILMRVLKSCRTQ
ncbi:MAG: hypothetical protein ABFD76_05220 [Smithella sp.]